MRRSERTPASRRVKRRPWHSRMRPRDSSWSANCWRSRTVTAPTWKLTVSSTSTSRGSCGISRCAGRSTSSGGPTAKWACAMARRVPLDLDALVERTTPALGFRIALGYAKDHMRSCAEDMTAGCPPSRSTLGWPRPSGPRPRRLDRRAGAGRAPSPSHWASTARRCPWRRTSRPARRPRSQELHTQGQPR